MIQYYTRFFTIAFLLLLFQVLVFDHVDLVVSYAKLKKSNTAQAWQPSN